MLFDKRSKLKDKLKSLGEDNDVLKDLIDVEEEITNEVAVDNRDKVRTLSKLWLILMELSISMEYGV